MQNVEQYTLQNGLQVFLEHIKGKETISCGVLVKQGAKDETEKQSGLSHLTEHVILQTDSSYSTRAAKDNLQKLEENGINYNGTTYKEYTTFMLTGLVSDKDLILENLFYIVAGKKHVNQEVLEKERKIVQQEAKGYLSSTRQIADRASQLLWNESSYGQMVIGTLENIEKFTAEQIDKLIADVYTPDNAALNIIGDFDVTDIKSVIERYFGRWSGRKKNKEIKKVTIISEPKVKVYPEYGKERSLVAITLPTYPITDERSEWVEVMKHIFTLPNSPIINELREKRGLVYSVNKFTNAFSQAGYLGVYFTSENVQAYEIINILIEQMKELAYKGIDSRMLECLKKRRQLEILFAFEKTEEYVKLANIRAMNNKDIKIEELLNHVKKMTAEKMNSIIKEVFLPQKMGIVVLGKLEEDKIQEIIDQYLQEDKDERTIAK